MDEDVISEERRVAATPDEEFQIKVQELRKVYLTGSGPCNPGAPLRAVERLSFGL
jgi:hypothetical protein